GVLQMLFSQTPVFLAKLIVVIILTYFLLAHREAFLLKAVKAVPTFKDKHREVSSFSDFAELGLGNLCRNRSCTAWLVQRSDVGCCGFFIELRTVYRFGNWNRHGRNCLPNPIRSPWVRVPGSSSVPYF